MLYVVWDKDETETFDFKSETRPRDRDETSGPRPSKILSRPRQNRDLRF